MTPEPPRVSDSLPADVLAAIQQGNKIEAIRRLRAARNLDLKGAKDLVDSHVRSDPLLARKYQQQSANARPLQWVIIAAALAMTWFWFFRR
jgi:ribosomal protein L7/L12